MASGDIFIGEILSGLQDDVYDLKVHLGNLSSDMQIMVEKLISLGQATSQSVQKLYVKGDLSDDAIVNKGPLSGSTGVSVPAPGTSWTFTNICTFNSIAEGVVSYNVTGGLSVRKIDGIGNHDIQLGVRKSGVTVKQGSTTFTTGSTPRQIIGSLSDIPVFYGDVLQFGIFARSKSSQDAYPFLMDVSPLCIEVSYRLVDKIAEGGFIPV